MSLHITFHRLLEHKLGVVSLLPECQILKGEKSQGVPVRSPVMLALMLEIQGGTSQSMLILRVSPLPALFIQCGNSFEPKLNSG